MESLNQYMHEYRKQMEKGIIPLAYKGLMDYILGLRTRFANKYHELVVSGNIYFGYMDMTYFALIPDSLRKRKLKIALVFLHEKCCFEVWLAGANKQVQTKYWKLIKEIGWSEYPIVSTTQGADSILEHVLVDNPDFSDLDALTRQIESGTLEFVKNIEGFLSSFDS
jgi:hypothetical protein